MYTYTDLYMSRVISLNDLEGCLWRLKSNGWAFHWEETWLLLTKEGQPSVMVTK